jgi:hypothetical protein
MEKLDYKKAYKALSLPPETPVEITVPPMTFIMINGKGDPNAPDGDYAKAVGLLYALTYAIKMSNKSGNGPDGWFDYAAPPLEGLWWYDDGKQLVFSGKGSFCWTAMIRQPEFVTPDVFAWACREAAKKKPGLSVERARLSGLDEGLCVQCMHLGPYDTERGTVERMHGYAAGHGLAVDLSDTRRHHEIYIADPRKTDPSKLRTVIRHPVKRTDISRP